jgi:hypothetical protein
MSTTRSGIIYNKNSDILSSVSASVKTATTERRSPRIAGKSLPFSQKNLRVQVLEDVKHAVEESNIMQRQQRSTRTSIPAELIREYCNESDNDSTSDYESEDEEVYQYTCDSVLPVTLPLYEVNIDFDEASAAWRSNKRRVGESWVYKLPISLNSPVTPFRVEDDKICKKQASALVSEHINTSIASRVKEIRRTASVRC